MKHDLLDRYEQLVLRYRDALDLSSPRMIDRLGQAILETEAFDAHLATGSRILDLGSGGGLPGVPIAIRRPDLTVILCERRRRRAAFLTRAVSELGLRNATVYNGDVRQYDGPPIDSVVAQAVATPVELFTLCRGILNTPWQLLTKRGPDAPREVEALRLAVPTLTETILDPIDATTTLLVARGTL